MFAPASVWKSAEEHTTLCINLAPLLELVLENYVASTDDNGSSTDADAGVAESSCQNARLLQRVRLAHLRCNPKT